jgi:hypothetical protein
VLASYFWAAGLRGPLAEARSLDIVRGYGAIGQCVHPNALPFSSRRGNPTGVWIELAIDGALGRLTADGTIQRMYAK